MTEEQSSKIDELFDQVLMQVDHAVKQHDIDLDTVEAILKLKGFQIETSEHSHSEGIEITGMPIPKDLGDILMKELSKRRSKSKSED